MQSTGRPPAAGQFRWPSGIGLHQHLPWRLGDAARDGRIPTVSAPNRGFGAKSPTGVAGVRAPRRRAYLASSSIVSRWRATIFRTRRPVSLRGFTSCRCPSSVNSLRDVHAPRVLAQPDRGRAQRCSGTSTRVRATSTFHSRRATTPNRHLGHRVTSTPRPLGPLIACPAMVARGGKRARLRALWSVWTVAVRISLRASWTMPGRCF
jgi:hypothetical protein